MRSGCVLVWKRLRQTLIIKKILPVKKKQKEEAKTAASKTMRTWTALQLINRSRLESLSVNSESVDTQKSQLVSVLGAGLQRPVQFSGGLDKAQGPY